MQKSAKYYNTLRYLRLSQTLGRVYAHLKGKFGFPPLPRVPESLSAGFLRKHTDFLCYDPWNSREKIQAGSFRFLNKTLGTGYPSVNWEPAGAELLWKYNLHYFNYLYMLPVDAQSELCMDWIRNNPPGTGTGWQPYPLSLRIVNWCKAGLNAHTLLESLYMQAAYLYRHTEFYHPANHYLENARALVFAGVYFKGTGESTLWLKRGMEILSKQTARQVLPDGAYFELSTMYHAIMLILYLDVLNILNENMGIDIYDLSKMLKNTASGMRDYLYSVVHPDNSMPLLNDSSLEIAPPPERIFRYAGGILEKRALRKNSFPAAGHFVFRDANAHLVIDGGAIGPDHIPAHAHADIFTYELSVKGERMITDSGTYHYLAGADRDYFRSTRAHNTLTVDGISQAECWGSFRVARRYRPEDVSFTETDLEAVFAGNFRGYSKLIGDSILHRRVMNCSRTANIITVTDIIEGEGRHLAESRIHLNSGLTLRHSGSRIEVTGRKSALEILVKQGDVEIGEDWISTEFGSKVKAPVITIRRDDMLPAVLIYQITY